MFFEYLETPIGRLMLIASEQGLREIRFPLKNPQADPAWEQSARAFTAVRAQLNEYFAGEREQFDLQLDQVGTPFQVGVWDQLCQIPYGETVSYATVAKRLGKPGAYRAVGTANGKNAIPIVVPCHRVIAGDGSLAGFAGGIKTKAKLLRLEGVLVQGGLF